MAVPKRFGVLRLIGTLLKIVAWLILIVAVLAAIGIAVTGPSVANMLFEGTVPENLAPLMDSGGGIFAGILILLVGLIEFLTFYALGENIHLRVALEENTRLTAALLLRMHQESQVEPEPTYADPNYPGFAADPFPQG